MNILMHIVVLNNETMVSALDVTCMFLMHWNMFSMFPLLNKKFRKCIQCRNVFDVKGLKGEWFLK